MMILLFKKKLKKVWQFLKEEQDMLINKEKYKKAFKEWEEKFYPANPNEDAIEVKPVGQVKSIMEVFDSPTLFPSFL